MDTRRLRAAVLSALTVVAAGAAWLVNRARLERAAAAARAVTRQWSRRPGARGRNARHRRRQPLPNLYDAHPEARRATPREIGLRSIDVDEIAGTAVGGLTQRGADFKPLPPFRSQNWEGRWQRIRKAVDQLAILPPIDVVRFPPGGRYWVLDGHNRVAAALDVGQIGIDANVTELLLAGQNPSERPGDLAAALAGTRSLRSAAQGAPLQTVADDVVLGVPAGDGSASRVAPLEPARQPPDEPEPGPRAAEPPDKPAVDAPDAPPRP